MSVKILTGNCIDVLRTLPGESVHCCITSPPYWGLRRYGTEPQVWGGDSACAHEWQSAPPRRNRKSTDVVDGESKQATNAGANHALLPTEICPKCGAWKGELGLEPTVTLYVEHIIAVFREVWRVLRKDGTCWVNLADTYISNCLAGEVLKTKDLAGIPWRVAFALQDDGWWLRQDIIYSKPNPMPESVEDRCTKSHEYVFHLAKSRRYFFDNEAIKEEATGYDGRKDTVMKGSVKYADGFSPDKPQSQTMAKKPHERWQKRKYEDSDYGGNGTGLHNHSGYSNIANPYVRNKRSVWTIPVQGFNGAHFATFPTELVKPPILASTSAKGCCRKCGAPWCRLVEPDEDRARQLGKGYHDHSSDLEQGMSQGETPQPKGGYITTGWRATCKCNAGEPVPCTVLDPFGGSGTTGLVAERFGRSAILIELNPEYAEMARKRISGEAPLFTEVSP